MKKVIVSLGIAIVTSLGAVGCADLDEEEGEDVEDTASELVVKCKVSARRGTPEWKAAVNKCIADAKAKDAAKPAPAAGQPAPAQPAPAQGQTLDCSGKGIVCSKGVCRCSPDTGVSIDCGGRGLSCSNGVCRCGS